MVSKSALAVATSTARDATLPSNVRTATTVDVMRRSALSYLSNSESLDLSEVDEDEQEDDENYDNNNLSMRRRRNRKNSVTDEDANLAEVKRMSALESQTITVFKVILLTTIMFVASFVSAGTYIVLNQEEEDDYENNYDQFTRTIQNAVSMQLDALYGSMSELSVQITSRARFSNQNFPWVTVPEWESQAQTARRVAGVETMAWIPLVHPTQRNQWETYSVQHHKEWMESSIQIAYYNAERQRELEIQSHPFFVLPPPSPDVLVQDNDEDSVLLITPYVYDEGSGERTPDKDPNDTNIFYGPVWQHSPVTPHLVNWNIVGEWNDTLTGRTLQVARTAKEGVFGILRPLSNSQSIFNTMNLMDTIIPEDLHNSYHQDLVPNADSNNAATTTASSSSSGVDTNFSSTVNALDRPHCDFMFPIFSELNNITSDVVGLLVARLAWDWFMRGLLPEGIQDIDVVLTNTCGQRHTYRLDGENALYLGEGDLHNTKYDETEVVVPFYRLRDSSIARTLSGHCLYSFYLYATSSLEDEYNSNLPNALALGVAFAFCFVAVTFFLYDWFVRRRNDIVLDVAAKSNAIVSSLFPGGFKNRLMEETEQKQEEGYVGGNSKALLKRYMTENDGMKKKQTRTTGDQPNDHNTDGDFMFKTKPIADLFTETTILFSDIAGFTSWSSTREPSQVFILLETIYKAFDEIAKKRKVFKVETVGDSYVAATGVPEPRKDHAVVMARFARDCLNRFRELVQRLEVVLGPDTTDLAMRFGMHSGPVTAGVLRGERSRFQLFGDTMNTASRMESNGVRDKIQLSQDTADLLVAAGKGKWIEPREEKIVAKGKGEMQTYWLVMRKKKSKRMSSDGNYNDDLSVGTMSSAGMEGELTEKIIRAVSWNVDLLMKHLRAVHAHRQMYSSSRSGNSEDDRAVAEGKNWSGLTKSEAATVLDEVKEIIHLPDLEQLRASAVQNGMSTKKKKRKKANTSSNSLDFSDDNTNDDDLDPAVEEEMTEYVTAIALLYRQNPFHNFEHASHVTMAVSKFMSRIVAPELDEEQLAMMKGDSNGDGSDNMNNNNTATMASMLHDYTYGITSDPLTQFACVFSALIHDVDHTGVPNTQLCKENEQLAAQYRGKSVAEQNSIDLAWNLLLDNKYVMLRKAIAQTRAEQERFRQLVVNSVLATDIMDKDLKKLRNKRWERAFAPGATDNRGSWAMRESPKDGIDRKATIVIEHLIQASDVAHTMQHWHVYRKWNERLFEELYQAFLQGRAEKDPSEFWYKGEIGFFDFYIIPLAKKLKDCGVFGVSSSECLDYATKNREEWINRGEQVVSEMVETVQGRITVENIMNGMNL